MKRRSFLAAIGLAPLAAWLSGRVEAKALPAPPPVDDYEAFQAYLSTPHARAQIDAVAPVPKLREWLGPKCTRIGVVHRASPGRGDCWVRLDNHRPQFARGVGLVRLRDESRVVTDADVGLPVYIENGNARRAVIGSYASRPVLVDVYTASGERSTVAGTVYADGAVSVLEPNDES